MGRPDIVLITVDSFRADCVGYLDGDHDVTPTIDELAADATFATSAIAPSSHTRASVPAILTSRYSHLFFSNFLGDVDVPTIARRLFDAGYETAAFHSNPLLSRHFGYDDGFGTFYDGLHLGRSVRLPETLTRVYSKFERLARRFPYEPAEAITRRATDWLASAPSPAFLWVHYMDPHGPYTLNRDGGYLDKFRSERLWHKAVSEPDSVADDDCDRLFQAYLDELRHTDHHLRDVLDAVRNRAADTVLVLTSDHGEEFREHGEFTHMPKLYEEIVLVPFVMDLPESPDGKAPDSPISLLDVTPTLLEQVDGASDDGAVGTDISTLVDGGSLDRTHVVSETNPDDDVLVGIRTDRWKYIATGDTRELYDLDADPGETIDEYGDHPDIEEELETYLTTHLAENDVVSGDTIMRAASIDDDMRTRLENLGYL